MPHSSLADGRRPQFLAIWASPCQLISPRGGRKPHAFYDLVLGVTQNHFHHVLLGRSQSLSPALLQGKGIKLQILEDGELKNLWICFRTTTLLLGQGSTNLEDHWIYMLQTLIL